MPVLSNSDWQACLRDNRKVNVCRKINWGRVVIGGIVAAVIAFITDGLLHEVLLNADWKMLYDNLGISSDQHGGPHVFYFVIFELGRGLLTIFVYGASG